MLIRFARHRRNAPRIWWARPRIRYVVAAALTILGGVTAMAAPVYTTLYTFKAGPDGYAPNSALVFGTGGTLYGTTQFGGSGCAAGHCGTVFVVSSPKTRGAAWTKTTLFAYVNPPKDGEYPNGVILHDGRLFGTTASYETSSLKPGYSVAFSFLAAPKPQTEKILSIFGDASIAPPVSAIGDLISNAAGGTLYGVSASGGTSGWGQVFSLTLVPGKWEAATIYNFNASVQPQGNLILDSKGRLYGVTTEGGMPASGGTKNCANGCGTVYELDPPTQSMHFWTQKILFNFTGGPLSSTGKNNGENDGQNPISGLAMDSSGNLYGTTTYGGSGNSGTVFELARPTSSDANWKYSLLYTFLGQSDGAYPVGGLTIGPKGVLYGTTFGGAPNDGTVFELTPPIIEGDSWTETVLHRFVTATQGSPQATLLLLDGVLYGTTANVGNQNQYVAGNTVFSIVP
jgi:uncharacterized repeat protein (TIGR03803 family)